MPGYLANNDNAQAGAIPFVPADREAVVLAADIKSAAERNAEAQLLLEGAQ